MTFWDVISTSNGFASSDVLALYCKVIVVLLHCDIGSVLYREEINNRPADLSLTEISHHKHIEVSRDDRYSESQVVTAGHDL